MEYERLDKRAILSWRISRMISLVVIAIFFVTGYIIMNHLDIPGKVRIYIFIGAGIILAYRLIATVLYPEIEYRQWRYAITEDKVEIRHGLFFINTTVIPIVRVQHISMTQGPINRKLGLYKITISLASGAFHIEGLAKEKADVISENLKNKLYTRLETKGV